MKDNSAKWVVVAAWIILGCFSAASAIGGSHFAAFFTLWCGYFAGISRYMETSQ